MHTKISLEQWSALVAIVEAGSFAAAAQRLHKSQSTLSYGIQRIESLLGVQVFEKQGRRMALTSAGQVLYRRARRLIDDAASLELGAGDLARGWEPEIRLAAEVIFPTWRLLDCLSLFSREHPEIRIELIESVLGGTDEALTERRVDLAIASRVPAGFAGDVLMPVRFVCAAAPQHPLHQLGRQLSLEDLRSYRHLVIRDSGVQRARVGGWLNEARWTVSHKATSIRAAVMGLGYAWYPEEAIREELDKGLLEPLPLRTGAERFAILYLVFADHELAGPGTRRLAQIVREAALAPAAGAPPVVQP